ncbi:hypothetical protein [Nonomuraea sp. NPDC049141]|uniref:hypothetical protein n=1 Tax=Nonomuraea sp. NPDC049141 TaxID=3155500 RepID=UPI0033C38F54
MTGPEHYAEAERLIDRATHEGGHCDPRHGNGIIAAAQVHATLALAAATALNDAEIGNRPCEWQAWTDTAGWSPS